ncbi:hypothetical protein TR75_03345 [Hydrogenibacillus schlegelii]|uniref:Uncharacterized protein n=1 Tax=Hydrogenibacillus schlegelii TaxID=1484 RepID=A0A132NBD8_HYDSH|nr:hypothetical protein TR75_03345 [Hydrogenibacillus schlegelii]OAR03986.1 hypothetical protein SA87_04260 [Hydrogenibacillus schlegelii]
MLGDSRSGGRLLTIESDRGIGEKITITQRPLFRPGIPAFPIRRVTNLSAKSHTMRYGRCVPGSGGAKILQK